jgi:hypothetical protein
MEPPRPKFRRRNIRIPHRVEVVSPREAHPRFLGYLGDVSEAGAFIQCSNPRSSKTCLSMLLHLPGGPPRGVRCRGEVVWTRGYAGVDGPCPGMGIRFIEVAGDCHDFLQQFCAESDLPDSVDPD